ncbi:low molecular weight protein arginine phosphatase [Haloimpatiens lingqiaonensis]|uniref:low molecular weight protein arginine phosphatase n=1 Tax=Haloimpatiens lingqiaonensis TaxID=1380675 RepID=UPI0010FDB67E|nr:low molecular weight protein arginine phosphatase [Haloimpatiens lingqiaonensis]
MKVLFVCTGNTCRSVMAEAIFNNCCKEKDICAFSAGLSVIPNSIASENAIYVVKENLKINLNHRKAIQIDEKIIENSDLILTMTSAIRDVLKNNFPKYSDNIFTLNDYIGFSGNISDPFGGNIEVYKDTFFELQGKIFLLIGKIREDKGIY